MNCAFYVLYAIINELKKVVFDLEERCIIQLLGSDEIAFLGRYTQYTDNIQEVVIFLSILDAQLYIKKNRLDRIGKIRKILNLSQTI